MSKDKQHQPVLLSEVLTQLEVQPNGIYIDGTFGRGGHAHEILSRLGKQGCLLVVDKDPTAIAYAGEQFGNDGRVRIFQDSFAMLKQITQAQALLGKVNGILLDLGVSSPQLDTAERGFSFSKDGPLDMRMDPTQGESAAQWIAHAEFDEIVKVLQVYGEERFARRIARAIVVQRVENPITTTLALANLIADVVPKHEQHKHPATRSFQAIRIFINKELSDLEQCLADSLDILAPGGRLAVISFHSLEDRIVKRFIRTQARGDDYPADLPVTQDQLQPKLKQIGKAIRPTQEEVSGNQRARSAVLRVAERLI